MTVTPTLSLRLSLTTQARLRQARQPGESLDSAISRALDALAGSQTAQDSPAALTPYVALASRMDALQADLGARVAMLEDWRASLAPVSPPGATQAPLTATQAPAPSAVHLPLTATQEAAPGAVHLPLTATQAYPLEVKREALAMQDAGQPNRVIGAFILEKTGRQPDSKNMGALLKQWRKALSGL